MLICLQLGLHPQASNHPEHPEEDLEAHQALVEDEVPTLWQKNENYPMVRISAKAFSRHHEAIGSENMDHCGRVT